MLWFGVAAPECLMIVIGWNTSSQLDLLSVKRFDLSLRLVPAQGPLPEAAVVVGAVPPDGKLEAHPAVGAGRHLHHSDVVVDHRGPRTVVLVDLPRGLPAVDDREEPCRWRFRVGRLDVGPDS